MKFNNMQVAHKLWGTIFGLLLAMLLVSVWAQMRTRAVSLEMDQKVAHFEEAITAAARWRGIVEIATGLNTDSLVTTDAALSKDLAERALAATQRINPVQEAAIKAAQTPADTAALQAIVAARAEIRGQSDRVNALKAAGDAAASQAYAQQEYRPRGVAYLAALDKYTALQEQQRDAARAAAEQASSTVMWVALASVLLLFAVGMVLVVLLVRSITQPLQRAVSVARAITAGDLTLEVSDPRQDEFGQLLQALGGMVAKLRGVVGEVRTGVDSVSTASNEIATGNQDLSERTEQTASSLQQTAASMEQLTSTVAQSADTARQANQLASTAAQAATRGGEVVAQVISTMQHISSSSKRIADIIGTIDGIAFQTNILALNAAVEAARAGEQGRGFAVVASEVRNLAQRSAEAAKEIKTLIGASVQTVDAGTQQVSQAGETMGEIVSSVRRVSDLIGEISAASGEQRDGIAQVNQAVTHLDQMTQQNAALVEQSAAAATGLRDQARRLAEVVSVFDVGGHAVAAQPAPRRAAPALGVRPAAPKLPARPAAKPLGGAVQQRAIAAPAKPAPTPVARRPLAAKPAAPALRRPVAITAKAPAAPGGEGDWESF